MPELPEVETIVRKLQFLTGRSVAHLAAHHSKTLQGSPESILNQPITSITRRAKIIHFEFANQQHLLIHLKMTGQLIYADPQTRLGGGHPTADWTHDLPGKHTRATFDFGNQANLFFNDQRLFGWIKILDAAGVAAEFSNLGPDVIDETFTAAYLAEKVARRKQPIKLVLLDNEVVCGLGNIYVCDALNQARISPLRPAHSLKPKEIEAIVAAAKTTIYQGIELGGTTFDGLYVDVAGFAGKYQNVVRVYGREGQPCQNCGGAIIKIKLGGRGTYYCPSCQS